MNKTEQEMFDEEFSPENLADYNKRPMPPWWGEPLPGVGEPVETKSTKGKAGRQVNPFLRGPVPLWWLWAAYKAAGGCGVVLGCALWHLRGMSRGPAFPVNIHRMNVPISEPARRKALRKLEAAKLLIKRPEPGKRLTVELIVDGAPVVPGSGEVKVQEP